MRFKFWRKRTEQDPDEILALLQSWILAGPDWLASQTYLQAHPELLTKTAVQTLAKLLQHERDSQIQEILILHQWLLEIAIQKGVEAAYNDLTHPEEESSTIREFLQAQVVAWLRAFDWEGWGETSQIYLQSHPQLLTDAAQHMLETLKQSVSDQKTRSMINLHLALLRNARVEGIEAAYKRFFPV